MDDSGSTRSLPPINNCSQLSCHRCIATVQARHGLVVQAQQAKAWASPLGPLRTHFSLPPPCTYQVPGLFTMLQHTNKQACSCCSQLSIMRLSSLHRHVDTTPAAKSATATTNRQLTCSCWKMISSRPQPQASQHCPLITTQNMPACSSLPKLLQTFSEGPMLHGTYPHRPEPQAIWQPTAANTWNGFSRCILQVLHMVLQGSLDQC